MQQAYTDKGSNVLYIREDGLLFVQLKPKKRHLIQTFIEGMRCNFEQQNAVVSGDIYKITSTGVVLIHWRIEQCL